MLAIHNEKELMEKVLINKVATDYKFTGEMKQRNIRWFPPVLDQIKHFSQKGVLMCVRLHGLARDAPIFPVRPMD